MNAKEAKEITNKALTAEQPVGISKVDNILTILYGRIRKAAEEGNFHIDNPFSDIGWAFPYEKEEMIKVLKATVSHLTHEGFKVETPTSFSDTLTQYSGDILTQYSKISWE